MCMYVNECEKTRRLFRGVRCWKVVMYNPFSGKYISPHNGIVRYEVGKVSVMGRFRKIGVERDESGDYVVNDGLHTYADLYDARIAADSMNGCLTQSGKYVGIKFEVMECRIPAFSRFIKGRDLLKRVNYVSDRIKVIKIV